MIINNNNRTNSNLKQNILTGSKLQPTLYQTTNKISLQPNSIISLQALTPTNSSHNPKQQTNNILAGFKVETYPTLFLTLHTLNNQNPTPNNQPTTNPYRLSPTHS
uniref:Uncharacterized protein n=1 Tax=Cacopsylla melanoneura TaxID=428564 RepID=A0A8D9A6T3_9HEMI